MPSLWRAWLFTCRHPHPTLRDRLETSMRDGLQAERQVLTLQRSLDVQTGIAREGHQRIDRLVVSLSAELRDHQETRRRLAETQALNAQLRTDLEEAGTTTAWARKELEDTQRGYEQLKADLVAARQAAAAKPPKRRSPVGPARATKGS